MIRHCNECSVELVEDNWYPVHVLNRTYKCNTCYGVYCKTKTTSRLITELKKYGLTIEEYYAMVAAQNNRCAICNQEESRTKLSRLSVDHDHTTGKVRGLLCFNCNIGLGKFKDSTALVRSAANYLERQNGTQ